MDLILNIKDIYAKSIELFGSEYLNTKDKHNVITNSWIYIEKAHEIALKEEFNIIVPQAKELITTINFLKIFKSLTIVDSHLNQVTDETQTNRFHNLITHLLKKSKNYEPVFNLISLPSFLINRPIDFKPIIESDTKTPDYLVTYKGEQVLIECKSSDFYDNKKNSLRNKVSNTLKKARKQLIEFPDIPGICQFKTNDISVFHSQSTMIDLVQQQIDFDGGNLSAILFTYYDDSTFPEKTLLHHLLLINFRSSILLPKGFFEDVFSGNGVLIISSKKGDKHAFSDIERVCSHYGIDPRLNDLDKIIEE